MRKLIFSISLIYRYPLEGCRAPIRALRFFLVDRRGGPAIEFAFVAPILIILLVGIIQFGYAFFIQNNMNNAAREGARALAVKAVTAAGATATSCGSTTTGTAEYITCDYLAALATISDFSVASCSPTVTDSTLCPEPTDVTVRVTIPRSAVALGDVLGFFSSGTMTAQATMREEG